MAWRRSAARALAFGQQARNTDRLDRHEGIIKRTAAALCSRARGAAEPRKPSIPPHHVALLDGSLTAPRRSARTVPPRVAVHVVVLDGEVGLDRLERRAPGSQVVHGTASSRSQVSTLARCVGLPSWTGYGRGRIAGEDELCGRSWRMTLRNNGHVDLTRSARPRRAWRPAPCAHVGQSVRTVASAALRNARQREREPSPPADVDRCIVVAGSASRPTTPSMAAGDW